MIDSKWIVTAFVFIFGGLFLYEHYSEVKIGEGVEEATIFVDGATLPDDLKNLTVILDDGKYISKPLRDAEHYLIYVSASWWPACQKSVPQLVEIYNESIKGNEKLEVILCSADKSESDALNWASRETFPWPTILQKDISKKESNIPFRKHFGRSVPQYILVDKTGKKVAGGYDYKALLKKAGIE